MCCFNIVRQPLEVWAGVYYGDDFQILLEIILIIRILFHNLGAGEEVLDEADKM